MSDDFNALGQQNTTPEAAPAPPRDEWTQPTIYGQGLVTIEPSTFLGVDPVPSAVLPAWQQLTDEQMADDLGWGNPTISGKRRQKWRAAREAPVSQRPEPLTEVFTAVPPTGDDTVLGDIPWSLDSPDALDGELTEAAGGSAPALDQSAPRQEPETDRRVLASSRTMAIASLVSRLTGFLRSLLLVAALGIADVSDAYNSANSFPNMVYELLLGGVLSSVFIPLIVHAQEHDRDGGEGYTQRLLAIATTALGVATLVAVAAAPIIAAAFVGAGPKRELTSILGTMLLPEIFFYGLGAMVVAVLNTRGVYGPGAWSPVLNNVVVIGTIGVFWAMPGPATLSPRSMTNAQLLVLGIGTTLGIVAQSMVLLPALRRTGFRWHWRLRALPNEVGRLGEVGSLASWVVGYVVASQVGLWVVLRVANRVNGAATSFTNADLLFQMPYGILGVSLLTALMPRMSRAAARSDVAGVKSDLLLGARLSAIGLVPVTAGLMLLGPTLGEALFSYGASNSDKARHVGLALALSAFGLVPFALVMLQLRVFYAMRDARTPTYINLYMVATKVVLVVLADLTLSSARVTIALNVATSASYVVGALAGHLLLAKRLGRLGFGEFAATFARVCAAAGAGGVVAFAALLTVRAVLGTGRLGAIGGLVLASAAGAAVMLAVATKLRFPEVAQLRAVLRR